MLARWQVVRARWWVQTSETGTERSRHAFEEVGHVAVHLLALAQLDQERLGDRVLVEGVDRAAFEVDPVAGDEDPAARSLEGDAVLGVVADVHDDAVGELGLDEELGRGVVAVVDGRLAVLELDREARP